MGESRGADIIFIVGINDKRIEKETRMHVKEYVRRAPDLYPKDLKQLYRLLKIDERSWSYEAYSIWRAYESLQRDMQYANAKRTRDNRTCFY